MKTAFALTASLLASPAVAQSVNVQAGPNGFGMSADGPTVGIRVRENASYESSGNDYRVRYQTNEQGYTVMQVVEPQGARAEVYDGEMLVASEDVPMSFNAASD